MPVRSYAKFVVALSMLFAVIETRASTTAELQSIDTVLQRLNIPILQLDFQAFLTSLPRERTLKSQLNALQQLTLQLKDTRATSSCDRVLRSRLNWQIANFTERTLLALSYKQAPQPFDGNFNAFNQGQRWYQHWLDSWLESSVDTETLTRVAHDEIRKAKVLLSDQHASLSETEALEAVKMSQTDQIERHFRALEMTVREKLPVLFSQSVFPPDFKVSASRMPASFPAPGYYNSDNTTFYYHSQTDRFELKSADWLFLHEAIPGHHMEFNLPNPNGCIRRNHTSMLVAEGWASYVETLGESLGLYTHPQSKAFALHWQLLRAVRVLLDTGIHQHGWGDEKAAQVWQQHFTGHEALFQRELQRIKNWPAQVNSYVYGKFLIESALGDIADAHPDYSSARRHDLLFHSMSFGAQGLHHIDLLIADESDNKKGTL